jgi:hypothetical protein
MVKQLLIYVRWWDNMINWMKGRLTERTSLDGAVLIGTALAILLLGPLAKIAAWIALVYGIWSIIKEE